MRPRGRLLKSALMLGVTFPILVANAHATTWQTVVNNGVIAPTSTTQTKIPYFFSYNQPAVNNAGQVVFRARAKPLVGEAAEGGSQVIRGVYTRVAPFAAAVGIVADSLATVVPAPNTTGATFTEFPSTPRADAASPMVATRGQSNPVITLPDGTRLGTSGVYTNPTLALPDGSFQSGLQTGASQVGSVPAYSYFQVPSEPVGTRFDQFPGSPSPLANRIVTFKGNYTVGETSKTGVFYRDLTGRTSPVRLVVKSGQPIPNGGGKVFGSAAPPSSAVDPSGLRMTVFAGFDDEENPTAGGIYIAQLGVPTSLRALVSIGSQVPGLPAGTTFNKFGEGISYDGRLVSFWGAWGTQTKIVHKDCPTDGNADLIAYCLSQYPRGVDLSVPANQGIFLVNALTGAKVLIARTNVSGFTDFLYWTYSGKPPGGEGDGDAEPPRWRSSAFTAVNPTAMAFKGQKSTVDGLYVRRFNTAGLVTALDTNASGQSVDPRAPAGSKVISIGVERDGFRGNQLAITASMLNAVTTASWAGVYVHNCGSNCGTW